MTQLNFISSKWLVGCITSTFLFLTPIVFGQTTTYQYNTDGLVISEDGPRTDVADITTYDYTSEGWLTTHTNALGHVTQWLDHNAYGLPTRMIDPNGVVTEMTYNARKVLINAVVVDPETAERHETHYISIPKFLCEPRLKLISC